MFTQTFVDDTEHHAKPLTLTLSFLFEAVALCLAILVPLIYTQRLPSAQLKSLLVAPGPPPAAPPKPPLSSTPSKPLVRVFRGVHLVAPIVIPKQVNPVNEVAPAPDVGVYSSSGGTTLEPNSILGVIGSASESGPPPPAPAKTKTPEHPLRISTGVSEANLIHKVQPVYPALAKSARVQGIVEFRAVIDKEGNIENLQLVRGHPLLVNAAKQAVLQWKYRPTLLNGRPVEVITEIIVNFTLSNT